MIVKLTDEQISRLPEYVRKWTSIGLSCEPCDAERAKAAVARCYQAAGLAPPAGFIVCDSPLSGGIVRAILADKSASVGASVGASVRESVGASVGASVRESVGASVGASIWESVRESVWASVWASVGASVRESVGESVGESVWASVWESVGASVRASVRESVGASVWESVGASVWASMYGAHDASWIGFYDYFRRECGLIAQTDKLIGLTDLAMCCGWCIPMQGACILQHRHSELHRDERGQLHNENGMAVKYRDGWGLYAWHGVRVPAEVIVEPQTIAKIDAESNNDIRSIRIERYGWPKYLVDTGAKPIDARVHPRESTAETLYRSSDGKHRFIVTDPATSKQVCLSVPREVQTCEQAQAFVSHGFDDAAICRT